MTSDRPRTWPASSRPGAWPKAACGGEALSDSLHEDNVTYDDLSPDTLLDETGARDPHEPGGSGGPADKTLRRVEANEIGGGIGLDEAELARSAPLDGEPWTDDVIDDEESKP